jgi:hypothetical protein
MLPTIKLSSGKTYYIDFEKGELRSVDDPTQYVRIEDVSPLVDPWNRNTDSSERDDSE